MILGILVVHIIFSTLALAVHETLAHIFADRIIANGWKEEAETIEFNNPDIRDYSDMEFLLDFYIPVINIFYLGDLIEMIRYTPEEVERMYDYD